MIERRLLRMGYGFDVLSGDQSACRGTTVSIEDLRLAEVRLCVRSDNCQQKWKGK